MLLYYLIKCFRVYLYARNALKLCYEDPEYGKIYNWHFDLFGMIYSVYELKEDKEQDHADIINKHLAMMNEYITTMSLFGIVKLRKYEYLGDTNEENQYDHVLIKYVPIFPADIFKLFGFSSIDITAFFIINWLI